MSNGEVRYVDWEIRDFSEGLIDKIDDNLLPENAAQDCRNFISRTIGSLKKRPGQTRLNSSAELGGPVLGLYAYYYDTPVATRRLVAASNGVVAWWNPDTLAWVNLKTGQSITQSPMLETCVNYMVCFDGVDQPWKWNGSIVSNLENAPVDGRFPVLHKEKLFVVPVTEPSTLRWSDSFQPESWPGVNYWDVAKGDGDEITCLRKHLGELVIFKRRSLHTLRGTNLDDFRLEELDSRLGCVGPFAAAAMGPHIYFVSNEGLCVFNGMRAINISSERIPKLWARINKKYLHKAAVGVWDGLVWFALPEGQSTRNNLVLVFAPSAEGVLGGKFWPWSEIDASCFQAFDDGAQQVFYSGDSRTGFVNQQAVGTADFGLPIHAYWTGKSFDQGSPEREKKARRVFVQLSPNTHSDVELQISLDYGVFDPLSLVIIMVPAIAVSSSLTLHAANPLLKEYRFDVRGMWRYITPKLIHNSTDECEVRGIMVPYKMKNKPRIRG